MNENFEISFEQYLNNFLNESTEQCFVKCVTDITNPNLATEEKICLNSCFEKYMITFSNTSEIFKSKKI